MQTFRHEVRQEIENILKKYNIEDRGALFEELIAVFDKERKPKTRTLRRGQDFPRTARKNSA